MFSIFRRRAQKSEELRVQVNLAWNDCLEAVLTLVAEHKWVVDEDDPTEIFCDGCGESLSRALQAMRR